MPFSVLQSIFNHKSWWSYCTFLHCNGNLFTIAQNLILEVLLEYFVGEKRQSIPEERQFNPNININTFCCKGSAHIKYLDYCTESHIISLTTFISYLIHVYFLSITSFSFLLLLFCHSPWHPRAPSTYLWSNILISSLEF